MLVTDMDAYIRKEHLPFEILTPVHSLSHSLSFNSSIHLDLGDLVVILSEPSLFLAFIQQS